MQNPGRPGGPGATSAFPIANRILSNSYLLWLSRATAFVAALIIVPLAANHFGLELIGILLMIGQATAFAQLSEGGLVGAVQRHVARFNALEDRDSVAAYATAALACLASAGLAVVVVALACAPFVALLFGVPQEQEALARTLLLLHAGFVALQLPLRLAEGLLTAKHRYDRYAVWDATANVTRTAVLVVALTLFNPDLVEFALMSLLPGLLSYLGMAWDVRRSYPGLRFTLASVNYATFKSLFSLGGAGLTVTFAATLLNQGIPLLAGALLGSAVVPLIAYPLLILARINPFVNVVRRQLSPIVSEMHARGEVRHLLAVLAVTARYTLAGAGFTVVIAVLAGHALMSLWISGPKVDAAAVEHMARALALLSAGLAFGTAGAAGGNALMASGKHWPSATASVVSSALGLLFAIALMKSSDAGIYGAALGVVFANLARALALNPYLCATAFHSSSVTFIVEWFARPTAALIASLAVGYVGHLLFVRPYAADFAVEIAVALAAAAFYALLCWLFVLSKEHRLALKAKVSA